MALKLTPEEKQKLRDEFQRTQPSLAFDMRLRTAMEILPVERRFHKTDGSKFYACQFPWLNGNGHAPVGAASRPRPGRPRGGDAPPTNGKTPPKEDLGGPITIDEALGVLCDVLVLRLRTQLDARLESMLASRVASAAIKLAPPSPKPAKLDQPETLDDETLRIEIIKARAQGNLPRWHKLVKVMRKRSEAANSIEFHSQDAQP